MTTSLQSIASLALKVICSRLPGPMPTRKSLLPLSLLSLKPSRATATVTARLWLTLGTMRELLPCLGRAAYSHTAGVPTCLSAAADGLEGKLTLHKASLSKYSIGRLYFRANFRSPVSFFFSEMVARFLMLLIDRPCSEKTRMTASLISEHGVPRLQPMPTTRSEEHTSELQS